MDRNQPLRRTFEPPTCAIALSGHFGYAAKIQPLEPWIGNVIARAFVNAFSKTHLIWNLETTGVLSSTKEI